MSGIELAIALAQAITSIMVGLVTWRVFSYTKKRDEEVFANGVALATREMNRSVLTDRELREAFEKAVYGDEIDYDDGLALKANIFAFRLNNAFDFYRAQKKRLVPKRECLDFMRRQATAMAHDKRLAIRFLKTRSYPKDFAAVMTEVLEDASPLPADASYFRALPEGAV